MTTIKRNWKTTAAGIVAIIGTVIVQFWPEYAQVFTQIAGIAAGMGLIAAPDAGEKKGDQARN